MFFKIYLIKILVNLKKVHNNNTECHLPCLVYYLLYNHAGHYRFAFTNFQCSTATIYVCLNDRRNIRKNLESHLNNVSRPA